MLKCVTASLNSCKMGLLVFLVYSMIGQLYADLSINLDNTVCGMNYSLTDHKNVLMEYLGSEILLNDKCAVKFTIESDESKKICVSGQEITLACGTELEYHASYISTTVGAEVEMSCGNETLKEWCAYVSQAIFIVVKKSPVVTSDVIRLKVFVYESKSNHNRTIIYTVMPIVAVAVVAIIILYCKNRRQTGYSASDYHVASDTVTAHTGDPNSYETTGYKPTPQVDYTGQQGHQDMVGSHGNQNGQPMLAAYPIGQQPAPVSPQDSRPIAVPPPSYNSAVGEGC